MIDLEKYENIPWKLELDISKIQNHTSVEWIEKKIQEKFGIIGKRFEGVAFCRFRSHGVSYSRNDKNSFSHLQISRLQTVTFYEPLR